MKRLQNRGILS